MLRRHRAQHPRPASTTPSSAGTGSSACAGGSGLGGNGIGGNGQGSTIPASGSRSPNRLNILLSWGGWREDSWADRMACLLEPLGVNSLRAQTARQAELVIRSGPVHLAVVDLGLPLDDSKSQDEAGGRILELLRRMQSPPPTVIVRSPSSARHACRDMSAALRVDAFAIVDRQAADVESMLRILHRAMDRFYQGRWPS